MKNNLLQYIAILFIGTLILSCSNNDSLSVAATDTGVGGSYARFSIVGDFMYVVNRSSLKTFKVEDPANPVQVQEQFLGENIETIFNFRDKLFIGSSFAMYIFSIPETGIPPQESVVDYNTFFIAPCDPIVTNETHAYVTLSTNRLVRGCGNTEAIQLNELKIFDITNINNPYEIANYPMHHPKGVGLDGDFLFLCDDTEGLKVFDISQSPEIVQIAHFGGFTAFDVIPLGGLLLVVGPENVYQYDYTDIENMVKLSEIPIEP